MDRRDFFGIIAAPLFRNLVPPKPMAYREGVAAILKELGVENWQDVADRMFE